MRRLIGLSLVCVFGAALVACQSGFAPDGRVAQFWRPISEPNILMSLDAAQQKLNYDLSQCHCGIYPTNASRDESIQFQPDRQRLAQTGVTVTPDENGQCLQKPSLIVTECMRQRGWEPTNCSGRMPLPGGGSLCAAYVQPESE